VLGVFMNYDKLVNELIFYRVKINNHPNGESMFFDSKGELMVIGYLAHEKNEEQPSILAEECNVSTARIACILNSLEKKNLITRKTEASDARKIKVCLTDKGLSLTKIKDKQIFSDMKEMLEFLGEEDATNHVRILKRISEYLSQKTIQTPIKPVERKNPQC